MAQKTFKALVIALAMTLTVASPARPIKDVEIHFAG